MIVVKGQPELRLCNSCSYFQNDLKQMMETLLRDQSAGVREEALELQDYLELRFTPTVN